MFGTLFLASGAKAENITLNKYCLNKYYNEIEDKMLKC
jgi:hypothetical protein